ncbi:MAG: MaoC/PaaZ C-terminal domain-containing protein [Hyphomicrobiaceae bacterium]
MSVDSKKIGFSRDSEEFRVNTARLAQFARALNDTNTAHLAGKIASPIFHHVPVMQSMVEVLRSVSGEFGLHGEHDIHFHRPIVPGLRLLSLSTLIGIGATKAGATLIIRSEIKTHEGREISTQFSTVLLTGEKTAKIAGDVAPKPPTRVESETPTVVTHALTDDQTFRYADAARDYSPYTLDAEAAAKLGFKAPIVHGMCTLGFAARAIVDEACKGDSARLLRLGGRFSQPLLMVKGQCLTTRLSVGPAAKGRQTLSFETLDRDGTVVVKNGFAEVTS